MTTSFINNILNSQPILIKFALKLFVCKCLCFQTHLFLDLRFPLSIFKLKACESPDLNMDFCSFDNGLKQLYE